MGPISMIYLHDASAISGLCMLLQPLTLHAFVYAASMGTDVMQVELSSEAELDQSLP